MDKTSNKEKEKGKEITDFDKLMLMYTNLTFFDRFGGGLILFILITIILALIVSYCITRSNSEMIAEDWPNQRCNLSVIPFAGQITHPEGVTPAEYTKQNFEYCTQQILAGITAPAVSPIMYIVNLMNSVVNGFSGSINAIRGMFDRIRNFVMALISNIISRIANIMIPMQKIILGAKDILGKTNGVMVTILYSALGGYYALKSLFGAIAQFISNILIALAVIIAILWAIVVIWPGALIKVAILTVLFLSIAIPTALMLIFMKVYLGVDGYKIPRLKCFDKNTCVPMNDGSTKIISEIKVGDLLANNNEVTGVIKVETAGSDVYYLDDIFVSDSHIVNYHGKWIPVSKHPDSIKCVEYNEPYLYCLNTSNKTIVINDTIFTDWDEIYEQDVERVIHNPYTKLNGLDLIHKQLDGGFAGNTLLQMASGEYRKIKDLLVGDKLANGEKVYGIVEINGANVSEQCKYILGENLTIEGGPNLVIYDLENSKKLSTLGFSNKVKLERKHNKLYHLLTDTKTIPIGNILFCDYNASIDIFLENKE